MQLEGKVDRTYEGNTCLVSPGCGKRGLAIPYAAVNVREGKVITQVANLSDHFVTLKEGYSIGSIEEVDEVIENNEMGTVTPFPLSEHARNNPHQGIQILGGIAVLLQGIQIPYQKQ